MRLVSRSPPFFLSGTCSTTFGRMELCTSAWRMSPLVSHSSWLSGCLFSNTHQPFFNDPLLTCTHMRTHAHAHSLCAGRRIPFAFLAKIQRDFLPYKSRARTSITYGLNRDFSPVLQRQMVRVCVCVWSQRSALVIQAKPVSRALVC